MNILIHGALASALFITTAVSMPSASTPTIESAPASDVYDAMMAIESASDSADMGSLTQYITYDSNAFLTADEQLAGFRFIEQDTPVEETPASVAVQAPVVTQPTQAPVAQPAAPKVLTEEQINFLGSCEAGMDPAKNTGNGYYGAFQFSYGTWKSMGTGYERADLAPIEVQKEAVQRLVGRSSIYGQFPACANRMRNAGLI